jgi:hypothetical protein
MDKERSSLPKELKEPTPDSNQISDDPRNRTRIEFTPINREYIYQLKNELDLSLSKVVNMLITESRTR